MARRLLTSESVAEGHPDKLCDRISEAVLDAILEQDKDAKVACETLATNGLVLVAGEISTHSQVDIAAIARENIRDIGYDNPEFGLDHQDCSVLVAVHQQSDNIAQTVFRRGPNAYEGLGAGDQGIMYGYACTETPELMPLPIMLSHALMRQLANVRRHGEIGYLRPDGKCQVTVEYEDSRAIRVHTVVLSAQHAPDVSNDRLRDDIEKYVLRPVLVDWVDERTQYQVNKYGRFVTGGPEGDTGMTGRKIEVDTYGGYGSHGGGRFLGKRPNQGRPVRFLHGSLCCQEHCWGRLG